MSSERKIEYRHGVYAGPLAEFRETVRGTIHYLGHSGRRLEKERSKKGSAVFKMYWADLARPNKSFLRFLFSFLQLLLHL